MRNVVPLVVDLDGALLRTNLFFESAFRHFGKSPQKIFKLVAALRGGRSAIKAHIANEISIDPANLPYNDKVLAIIAEARSVGREVYLASASNEKYVKAIMNHLDCFDGYIASNGTTNLKSQGKAASLLNRFGPLGFDYIGDSYADYAVWKCARRKYIIEPQGVMPQAKRNRIAKRLSIGPRGTAATNTLPYLRRRRVELRQSSKLINISSYSLTRLRQWLILLRIHHWSKNALVMIPVLTAHRFDAWSLALATTAFIIFSLAASAVYILNDLIDIDDDRKHPRKKARPLAAGTLPIGQAISVAIVALFCAAVIATLVSWPLLAVLAVYVTLTSIYSVFLKRKLFADVITLAALYSLRVIGGAVAVGVPVSEWLLAFSLFAFTALALVKRYVEVAARLADGMTQLANRNYRSNDLEVLTALAVAASFNAITVFTLFISSESVKVLYTNPWLLWMVCPLMMYWFGRIIFLAHRRELNDDPIVFALTDWNSYVVAAATVGLFIIAK